MEEHDRKPVCLDTHHAEGLVDPKVRVQKIRNRF
jgi:hypothetical protein